MSTLTTSLERLNPAVRDYTHETPFWISSKLVNYAEATGKTAVVFKFPKGTWKIIDAGVEIVTLCAGGSVSIDVGLLTVGTEAGLVDGCTLTYSALDGYVDTTDITEGTAAYYPSAVAAYAGGAGSIVVGATTTMPVVGATCASGGTSGAFRVHMLVSRVPVQAA